MRPDERLSAHFTLYDLTRTNHKVFQTENRTITDEQVGKLRQVAALLETVQGIIGPLIVSSGYRCAGLNAAVGSTDHSQHLKCEAADLLTVSLDKLDAFELLRKAARRGEIRFGQLIYERADREGARTWVHISVAEPYREAERCGQCLVMEQGEYKLVETIAEVKAA